MPSSKGYADASPLKPCLKSGSKRTDPKLAEEVKDEVLAEEKGGGKGNMSAWKAGESESGDGASASDADVRSSRQALRGALAGVPMDLLDCRRQARGGEYEEQADSKNEPQKGAPKKKAAAKKGEAKKPASKKKPASRGKATKAQSEEEEASEHEEPAEQDEEEADEDEKPASKGKRKRGAAAPKAESNKPASKGKSTKPASKKQKKEEEEEPQEEEEPTRRSTRNAGKK